MHEAIFFLKLVMPSGKCGDFRKSQRSQLNTTWCSVQNISPTLATFVTARNCPSQNVFPEWEGHSILRAKTQESSRSRASSVQNPHDLPYMSLETRTLGEAN